MNLTAAQIELIKGLHDNLQALLNRLNQFPTKTLWLLDKIKLGSIKTKIQKDLSELNKVIVTWFLKENPGQYFLGLLNTIVTAQQNFSDENIKKEFNFCIENIESFISGLDLSTSFLRMSHNNFPKVGKSILRIISDKNALTETKNSSDSIIEDIKNKLFGEKYLTILNQLDAGLFDLTLLTKKEINDLLTSNNLVQLQINQLDEKISLMEKPLIHLKAREQSLAYKSENASFKKTKMVAWSEDTCFDQGYMCRSGCVHDGEREVTYDIPDLESRTHATKELTEVRNLIAETMKNYPSDEISRLKGEVQILLLKIQETNQKINSLSNPNKELLSIVNEIRSIYQIRNAVERASKANDIINENKTYQRLGMLFNELSEIQRNQLLELLIKVKPHSDLIETFVNAIKNEQIRLSVKNSLSIQLAEKVAEVKVEIPQASAPSELYEEESKVVAQPVSTLISAPISFIGQPVPSAPSLEQAVISKPKTSRIEELYLELQAKLKDKPDEWKAFTSNIPDEFLCPISQELMMIPVIAQDGHNYEESEIKKWISNKVADKKPLLSPKTLEPLPSTMTIENKGLQSQIISLINDKLKQVNQAAIAVKSSIATVSKQSGSPIHAPVVETSRKSEKVERKKNISREVVLS